MHSDTIAIFVATHVHFDPPNNPIYIPLHVGKNGKQDLGYIGYDTGDNISDLNPYFAEITGLYWIWKNIRGIDYAGLCHYRRYFINKERRELSKTEYLDILKEYDAIVPKHAECEINYRDHYGRAHNIHDLDAIGHAICKLFPEYMPAYEKAMSERVFFGGNLFVTSLDHLKEYAEWLFTILSEAGEEIDISSYDGYQIRVYGFLSEQMFYVFSLAKGLKLCEVTVGISDEKAETKELIIQLKDMIEKKQIEEARRLFDRRISERPDLMLPGSDIQNELNEIYHKLIQ